MALEISVMKDKRELVDRVANSPTFQKSPRLREFLVYVADCTISERFEGVREQQIAANVFRRKPDFNPGQDNIVRVEARSLRKRLEAYFATEGKDEPVIISMPKGSYTLNFEPRSEPFAAEVLEMANPKPTQVAKPSLHLRWLVGVLWMATALLAGLFGAEWGSKRSEKAPPSAPPGSVLPFSALIDSSKETYVVTSDSGLVLIQDLRRQQVDLDDYITGRYTADMASPLIDTVRQDLIRTLLKRRYTNSAETSIAGRIIERYGRFSANLRLRAGHGVQLADFKDHNAILFGSLMSNPWARLFSDKLNFQFELDKNRRGVFRNRSPRPGEQEIYAMTTDAGNSGKAYALAAFVPNGDGNSHVLLIGGTTAEGTEAAGEFITDDVRTTAALRSIGIDPHGPPRYFEILLEVKAVAGHGSQSRILASRLLSDSK